MNSVTRVNYTTSLDERGFIPVYEYEVNKQNILWDSQKGDVYLTGLWKALGYTKTDVIRTIKLNPGLKTKKIRGGLLKIQGTWVPYDQARSLSLQTAWPVRYLLIPLFGTQFVDDCLSPNHPNYRASRVDALQVPPIINLYQPNTLISNKSHANKPCFTPLPPMMLSHILNSGEGIDSDNYGTHHMNMDIANSTLASFVDNNDQMDPISIDGAVKVESTGANNSYQELKFKVVPIDVSSSVPSLPLSSYNSLFHMDPGFLNFPMGNQDTGNDLSSSWSPFATFEPPSPLAEMDAKLGYWTTEEMAEMIKTTILLQSITYQDNAVFRQVAPSKVVVSGVEFSIVWE